MKNKILKEVFDFFNESNDFNGTSLTKLAKKIGIDYLELLPIIKELVMEDKISLQGYMNPHIVRTHHYDKDLQLKILAEAENNKTRIIGKKREGDFEELFQLVSDSHTVCAYPTPSYLKEHLVTNKYDDRPYTKRLAYGEPQLEPVFFEIEVLEKYYTDPRYSFEFQDYSGYISIVEPPGTKSSLREHDQAFLQTFGLGYDDEKNRVATVFLRYLCDLSPEHQIHWRSKEMTVPCSILHEYHENEIVGNWTNSYSIFSAVIEEQRLVNDMGNYITGKNLFNNTFEEKRPKEFTFFTTPTLSNYDSFVALLDKMLSDNLNKDFFKGTVDDHEMVQLSEGVVEKRPKGTLRMLEEWLRTGYKMKNEKGYDLLMAPFRKVRKERQNPAHKIRDNYYDKEFSKQQIELLKEVYKSLSGLRMVMSNHPTLENYKLPTWINEGKIKMF